MADSDFNIPDQTPRVQYIAAPGQSSFPVPFRFFDAADIFVLIGIGTSPLDPSDYAITGERENDAGTLELTTPLVGGELVTIYRQSSFERVVNFQNSGEWQATNVN